MPSSYAVPDFLGATVIAFMSGGWPAEPLGGSSRV
jgi:hypothetical protein